MTIGAIYNSYFQPASYPLSTEDATNPTINDNINDKTNEKEPKVPGKKSSPSECQTCKNRKYQDSSNENDVSFKAPTHISPQSAGALVRAHEGQHVSNAFSKAAENNGEVVSCSVTLQTDVCPECGRVYISGGLTNTTIKYQNESNPYIKNLKGRDAAQFTGAKIDYAA